MCVCLYVYMYIPMYTIFPNHTYKQMSHRRTTFTFKGVWRINIVAVCCSVTVCCSGLQCYIKRWPASRCRCSVLQCVAVCCSVLQCVAVCCSVLQCVAVGCSATLKGGRRVVVVAVCCNVLQCVAVCCSVVLCIAVHCSALQCVTE